MDRPTTITVLATPAIRPRRARFPSRPAARSEASEVPQRTTPPLEGGVSFNLNRNVVKIDALVCDVYQNVMYRVKNSLIE